MPLSFQFANNIFCSNLLLYYCHYIQFLKVCVTYNTYKLFLIETQLVWYSYDTTVEDTPLLNKAQASPGVTCTKPCRTNPTWTTLWKQWPLWKHTKSEWKHNIQLNCVCPPQCMVLSSCHVENKQQSRSPALTQGLHGVYICKLITKPSLTVILPAPCRWGAYVDIKYLLIMD